MLSKEEINNMRKYFDECIEKDTIYEEDLTINFMKIAKEYVNELEKELYLCTPKMPQCQHGQYINYVELVKKIVRLEEREQKLIEKLEGDIVNITKTMQDGKHWDDYSRCRLKAYRTKTKEILEILKGES